MTSVGKAEILATTRSSVILTDYLDEHQYHLWYGSDWHLAISDIQTE